MKHYSGEQMVTNASKTMQFNKCVSVGNYECTQSKRVLSTLIISSIFLAHLPRIMLENTNSGVSFWKEWSLLHVLRTDT